MKPIPLLGALCAGWELVLMLALILAVAATARAQAGAAHEPRGRWSRVRLFVAQGFGIGRVPLAPGTFGSILGLIWFAALVLPGNLYAYVCGALEGIVFSVWFSRDAEQLLGERDPGSVVIDEVVAIPFCFLPWLATAWAHSDGALPHVRAFFSPPGLWWTLGLLALFRVFDIAKPWPVGASQRLPGGWGVTADDMLAAAYVALIALVFMRFCTPPA